MKVIESLQKGKPTLSFEFFPPKTKEREDRLFEVIGQLKKFNPDFASVTCGALGTNHDKTLYWVKELKHNFEIEPVAHLTCVAAACETIHKQIDELDAMGAYNVLALRGDPPAGREKFVPPEDGFRFARELITFIKRYKPHFCLGAAGYPDGHNESPSLSKDTLYLKEKVEAGADYIITQLFFDNRYFFDFKERCDKAGIKSPIIPGIMPITSYKQVKKMTEICGATIPSRILERLEKFADDKKAIERFGVEQAVSQCQELLDAEVLGLHFFVLNRSGPISEILAHLKLDRQQ